MGRGEGGVLRRAPDDADRGAAVGVNNVQHGSFGAEGVRLAPLAQRHEDRPQVPALAG
ncbi:hypothetical protein GCM10029978_008260 [Actinoallomurus acanthiterrae]